MSSSGIKNAALSSAGTNQATAANAVNAVTPVYQQMLTGNDGLSSQQKADALTSASQSGGGAVASAVGQGNLMAARTGNAGGYAAALDDASRGAGATQSAASLGVQTQSDQLAHQNQLAGLAGESGIYSNSDAQANDALKTASSVGPGFWQQLLMSGIGAAGQAGAAYEGRPPAPCYVAAELYGGWDEPRTVALRRWLTGSFSERLPGRMLVAVYARHGQSWAVSVRRYRAMRWFFESVFNLALKRALRAQAIGKL